MSQNESDLSNLAKAELDSMSLTPEDREVVLDKARELAGKVPWLNKYDIIRAVRRVNRRKKR